MDINIILIPTPIMTIIGAAATDVLCYRCIVEIGLVLLLLLLPSIAITITVITISIMIIKQTCNWGNIRRARPIAYLQPKFVELGSWRLRAKRRDGPWGGGRGVEQGKRERVFEYHCVKTEGKM